MRDLETKIKGYWQSFINQPILTDPASYKGPGFKVSMLVRDYYFPAG